MEPVALEHDHTLIQIVAPRTGRAFTDELHRESTSVILRGNSHIAVNDSSAALAGLGVVTTYAFLAQPHLATGALQRLFPQWQIDSVPAHVAYPVNRHLPVKVRVFIEWVVELLGQR